MFANLSIMNHFLFMVLAHNLHFFLSMASCGFKIPIASIPRELHGLCVTNLIHPNNFGEIIILFNL